MSVGFQARADLVVSDHDGFLYQYACCNLNLMDKQQTAWETEDGEIWISRDALIEPVIHEKMRKMPSGKRKPIVKRTPQWAPVEDLIAQRKIIVRNASGTWEKDDSVDIMAIRLIRNFFQEYQVQGEIPQQVYVIL